MPGPALYVVAILGGVAAGIAFKEFVYDPHIAPKFDEWRAEFEERRRIRRRQATAMSNGRSSSETASEGVELQPRSSPFGGLLRRRGNAGAMLDEGPELETYPSMMPTHVISSGSGSGTPTVASSTVSRSQSPSVSVDTLRSPTRSLTVFDTSDSPSPLASSHLPIVGHDATENPSLSLLYDHREHDEELVETPSSPSSLAGSDELFMSFTSPRMTSTMSDAFGTASPRMSSVDFDSPRIQSPNFEATSPRLSSGSEDGIRSPFSDFSDILGEENGSEMSWTSAR